MGSQRGNLFFTSLTNSLHLKLQSIWIAAFLLRAMDEAQGTSVWSNEDRYVSRMNLRHKKHLKKQLAGLERERHMKTKSLDADRRTFEEKIHRLNIDPSDRAHLSRDANSMIVAEKKKELDRLLKSLMHRPYETRAGYSYIEYLSKNMQPLVKRPLQWGINPPLSPRKDSSLVEETHKKTEPKKQIFLTQIEGQPMSLSQRASMPTKSKARAKGIVLPPIASAAKPAKRTGNDKTISPRRETATEETPKIDKEGRKSRQKEQKVDKKALVPLKNSQETRPSDVFVTMATLKVPTPNYPPFVDAPTPGGECEKYEENIDDNEEESKEQVEVVEVGSHSQSNYSISMLSRFSDRRKSI